MNHSAENYVPTRASDRTEKLRLVDAIVQLQKKLEDVEAHSVITPDPSYARSAYRYRQELAAANEKLAKFVQDQQDLDARRVSEETQTAEAKAVESAAEFEKALQTVALAGSQLIADAADLADALHVTDQIWPSKSSVNDAVRSRVVTVFGNLSTIKLPGYGSVGKSSEILTKRFELNQGK